MILNNGKAGVLNDQDIMIRHNICTRPSARRPNSQQS